jgi:hypothetical protein
MSRSLKTDDADASLSSRSDSAVAASLTLDERAERAFAAGESAGTTSDKYIRTTVFLASVLFLVGISTQFPYRGARYALLVVGAVLLVVSLVQVAQLPRPPA